MCLLALYFRVLDDIPFAVGANREEYYARGGTPPQLLPGACSIVAGVDPVAGGTWLGINQYGLLAAITNRGKSSLPAQPRSRGLLLRELLGYRDPQSAVQAAAQELGQNRYAGCNLVCASRDELIVVQAGDWLRIRPLPPGLHVLTSKDIDDPSDERAGHAARWLGRQKVVGAETCVNALQSLCSQTGNGQPAMCIRGKEGGTVSSTIVLLGTSWPASRYLHAQGPPDRTPYEDHQALLRGLDKAVNT
jgi:uncharacterized protein with NRDE domain